jgi:hypothetical protein
LGVTPRTERRLHLTETDPWSIASAIGITVMDQGSGSRIPVRQKVRDACHGGTIPQNGLELEAQASSDKHQATSNMRQCVQFKKILKKFIIGKLTKRRKS